MIRIGINGFGRIGRTLFKLIAAQSDMQVVSINDPQSTKALVHLLKFDSIHGKFDQSVISTSEGFSLDDKKVIITHASKIEELKWPDIDVVVDATGKFKTAQELKNHLENGAKSVMLTVPSSDDSVKMIVMGVNEGKLTSTDKIISNASCTTNSAAHLINLMKNSFTIDSCFITTVHSYTTDQNLQDAPHRDLRRSRAAAQSIIPTTTGAAKALTKIFPELGQEIGGCGIRVPVANGSLTDLTFILSENPTAQDINFMVKEAANSELIGILKYTEDPIVSRDIIGNSHSCVFDSKLTSVVGKMVKLVGWYDNEMGYSSRLIDLIRYHQSLL